ncbi:MAG: lysine--tRNA ligase [Chloroflexi bacterium]|nr:lysine--tRNA ligase [Chloroflexota bacterium]
MYWADELAEAVAGPQVINDSKTPSGTVHVGSLRGVVLHDAVLRALRDRGRPATFLYGVDDMDPMDTQAHLSGDAIARYMGVPLSRVPAPEGSGADSYARYFVGELFLGTFARLGIHPATYWMSDRYRDGSLDPAIRRALDRAEVVRDIYRRVSRVEKSSAWLPISVVCEDCGRIGTTDATAWDGETVAYRCAPDAVTWAVGCGHSGRVAPFRGRAKLKWNVDWAAKWTLLGVTIEGCGKDLATAGGSRERSDAISREVFEREPPLNIAYEFLNIGGRKMSTSRGTGASAHEIAALLPGELLRFLFLRHKPRKAIDFDPEGDTIPGLFDEFDRIATAVAGRPTRGELPPDPDRIFRQSLVGADADGAVEAGRFRPSFRHLALLLQVPGVDLGARMAAEKGQPLDDEERRILDQRTAIARLWLDTFAPDRYRIEVHEADVPAGVSTLTPEQRGFLGRLAAALEGGQPMSGDGWQDLIFRVAQERSVPSGAAFTALYQAFLGRANGPRAGWLLASLSAAFVSERLRAASALDDPLSGVPAAPDERVAGGPVEGTGPSGAPGVAAPG